MTRRLSGAFAAFAAFGAFSGLAGCGPAPAPEGPAVVAPAPSGDALAGPSRAPRPPLQGEAIFFLDTEQVERSKRVAVAPDGSRVAIADARLDLTVLGGRDGKTQAEIALPGEIAALSFSADSSRICAITALGAAVWSASDGRPVFSTALGALGHRDRAMFSPSGKWLATLDATGALRIVDVDTGAVTATATVTGAPRLRRFSTASDRLLTGMLSKWELWEVPSGKKLADLEGEPSPDLRLTAPRQEGLAIVRDAVTGAELWRRKLGTFTIAVDGEVVTHPVSPYQLVWSRDGQRLAILSDVPDVVERAGLGPPKLGQVTFFDVATRKGEASKVRVALSVDAQWSRDGAALRVGVPSKQPNVEGEIGAIDPRTRRLLKGDLPPGDDPERLTDAAGTLAVRVRAAIDASDGRNGAPLWQARFRIQDIRPRFHDQVVASGASPWVAFTDRRDDSALRVLRLDRGQVIAPPIEGGLPPQLLDAAGPTLLGFGAGARGGGVTGWAFRESGVFEQTFTTATAVAHPGAISPDGKWIAATRDGEVEIFDAKSGRSLARVPTTAKAEKLAFNPEGTLLGIWSRARFRTVKVPSGAVAAEIDAPRSAWWWRAGGELVVPADEDLARVDGATGTLLARSPCKLGAPSAVSPSGGLVVAGREVIEIAMCTHRLALPAVAATYAFSRDERHLVAVLTDEPGALIFSLETNKLVRTLRVPVNSTALGPSADLVVIETWNGAIAVRPETGAFYRVDLVGPAREASVIASLDTGHFGAPDALAGRVRLFFPGAKDGPLVRAAGGAGEPFRRADVHLDFFRAL